MSDHEIYARNLLSDKGFAPWLPRPVNIAEVGYVVRGGWISLFNASKKPGDVTNKLGVPNGYRPLDVGELDTTMLSSGFPITNERGTSLEFGIKGSSAAIAVMSAEAKYTFTSSKQEGAILVPGGNIDTADALEHPKYVRYIRENSASWLEFANKRHTRGIRLIDLVLVTGWHKTASWACATFSQCSREINLTFNVGGGTTQGGVWGKWSDIVSPGVWGHSGPLRVNLREGQLSPHQSDQSPMIVDNLESIKLPTRSEQMEGAYQHCSADVQALGTDSTNIRDQGIFIRGYKICDRHTGLARIFHRRQCLKYRKDGFTFIHPRDHDEVIHGDGNNNRGDEDTDRDGDPSSSRRDSPSGGPGNSSSSSSLSSSSSGSQGGAMSRSFDGNSSPSSSSHRDNSAYGFKLDDDLVLYLQLNCNKEPTAVEIILEYILENSIAEFSLAHDDDVTDLLHDGFDAEDFAVEIRKISPQIFVVDQVGMLYQTFLALSGDRRRKGHMARGTPSTGYVPHTLQHKPPTDPLPEYSQTDQPIKSTGRSSQLLAPITPRAFELFPLLSSWDPSLSLLNHTAPINLPEVTGAASEGKIAIDGKDVGHTFNDRQERLPSLHNVVDHTYGTTSSTYTYRDIARSLPPVSQHPSYDRHDPSSRGPKLAPIHSNYSESPSGNETYSSYSSAAPSSSPGQYSHSTGYPLVSGFLRSSADYPMNADQGSQTFYAGNRDLIPVSSLNIQPQGLVRSCDIPEESDDQRKKHKCPECGKVFDRLSSLDTHSFRHTGSKPYACPASDCDKTFGARSNMKRHYHNHHAKEEEETDHTSTPQHTYSSTLRGSSDQSPRSGTYSILR